MANSLQALAEETNPVELDQDDGGGITGVGRENKSRLAYWKKAPTMPDGTPSLDDGYIVVAEAEDRALLQKTEKGMQLLRRYGFFQKENPNEQWSSVQDPWKRILLNGGAVEFPVKQIVELGWHRPGRLPRYARRIKFPQLKGVEVHDVECPSCRRVFSSLDDPAELLARHQQVAHREISQTQNVTRALTEAQSQLTGPLAEVVGTIKTQVESQGIIAKETADAILKLAEAVAKQNEQPSKRT